MIIAMDNEKHRYRVLSALAHMYPAEGLFIFSDGLNYAKEKRLTFSGHATPTGYGATMINPYDFAQHLISHGLTRDEPVVIDLLGCSIGDINHDDSYAMSVAKYLYQAGYVHVRVNAVNAWVTNEPENYPRTFLYPPAKLNRKIYTETKLVAVKAEQYQQFSDKLEKYDQRAKSPTTLVNNYSKTIYKTKDIRHALDNNANFQITYQSMRLPQDRRKICMVLSNHIAQLKQAGQSRNIFSKFKSTQKK